MKCLLHSPQTLRPCFTFLEPELPWFPSLDYHGAEGAAKQVQPMSPLDLQSLGPYGQNHKVRNKAGPSTAKPRQVHSKDGGMVGIKILTWKGVTWSTGLQQLGFPPVATFLRVTPTSDHTKPSRAFACFEMSPMD